MGSLLMDKSENNDYSDLQNKASMFKDLGDLSQVDSNKQQG